MKKSKSLSLREIAPIDRDATRTHCNASICAARPPAFCLTRTAREPAFEAKQVRHVMVKYRMGVELNANAQV